MSLFSRLLRRNRDALKTDPIFLIGVPRSGTTLLRVLFDSHSRIACGPETPWLARHACSIKNLYRVMADEPHGYVKSFEIERERLRAQGAEWVDRLFKTYAEAHHKARWAEKTPDHSLEIDFLSELFPKALFIHIVRDGRDVACSTAILSDERKAISEWHTRNLLMDDGMVVPNTVLNAALRWKLWTERIEAGLASKRELRLRYEDLIRQPVDELQRLMAFIGEKFEPGMLDFSKLGHHYPGWEWGSRDVVRQPQITDRSIERWKKQLSSEQVAEIETAIGDRLKYYGYHVHA